MEVACGWAGSCGGRVRHDADGDVDGATGGETRAPRIAGRCHRSILRRRSVGRRLLALHFRRLAKPLAQRAQLTDLRAVELVVPVLEILHGLIEPLDLMLRSGPDHTASNDMLEHLIPSLVERTLGLHFLATTVSLLGHV